ncbi:BQ2448_2507 [Microbotryum intermedium]|uniref:BQ2448_2507 protein n=1 Tax=Microbotryum intermedium TaxID=269621 RepID=A0A238F8M7_9BASI|nr:BQ2448_2507 [Microbotryum intermedium]
MESSTHEDRVQSQLFKLTRHYQAKTTSTLIPASQFPTDRQLSYETTQQQLVHLLIDGDDEHRQNQQAGAWEKVFWRRIVNSIETGFADRRRDGDGEQVDDEEVHPSILEEMVKHLSASSTSTPSSRSRKWSWGPLLHRNRWKSVVTHEDGRIISAELGTPRESEGWARHERPRLTNQINVLRKASIALSNHLIASPTLVSGATASTRVVELGAGVGLVSLVAASLNPTIRVLSTDVNPDVLAQLELNVCDSESLTDGLVSVGQRAILTHARSDVIDGLDDRIRVSSLDWEDMASSKRPLNGIWSDKDTGSLLILGADVVYDPTLASYLAATLSVLLRPTPKDLPSNPAASTTSRTTLIAGTIRNESTWELFLTECTSRSLMIEPVDLLVPPEEGGIVGTEDWEGEVEVRLIKIVAKPL